MLLHHTKDLVYLSHRCLLKKRYLINHRLLDDGLVSHDIAWFWGMALTDGTVATMSKGSTLYNLSWKLKYDDYSVLEQLRHIAGSDHFITFDASPNGLYPFCTLVLNSKQLVAGAVNLMQCNPRRKTFVLQFPEDIDPKFVPSFIRGLIDGDGSWEMAISCKYRTRHFMDETLTTFCSQTRWVKVKGSFPL